MHSLTTRTNFSRKARKKDLLKRFDCKSNNFLVVNVLITQSTHEIRATAIVNYISSPPAISAQKSKEIEFKHITNKISWYGNYFIDLWPILLILLLFFTEISGREGMFFRVNILPIIHYWEDSYLSDNRNVPKIGTVHLLYLRYYWKIVYSIMSFVLVQIIRTQ